MPRRRLRTFTLWTGTLLCVLIAMAFVVSGWWSPMARLPGSRAVSVAGGGVWVWVKYPAASGSLRRREYSQSGWNEWRLFATLRTLAPYGEVSLIVIPLWPLFLAVAIPTLLVWRFSPKPIKPEHCRCGYNLKGNTSGVCPECGVEVQA